MAIGAGLISDEADAFPAEDIEVAVAEDVDAEFECVAGGHRGEEKQRREDETNARLHEPARSIMMSGIQALVCQLNRSALDA
jgi:hypothetical protein